MIGALEWLGDGGDPPLGDRQDAGGVGKQVQRPMGIGSARRDQKGTVWLLDIADGCANGHASPPAASLDRRDLAPAGELLAELPIDGQSVSDRIPSFARYLPRCQDLPSVCTAGA
jgi:hypothetical protein